MATNPPSSRPPCNELDGQLIRPTGDSTHFQDLFALQSRLFSLHHRLNSLPACELEIGNVIDDRG